MQNEGQNHTLKYKLVHFNLSVTSENEIKWGGEEHYLLVIYTNLGEGNFNLPILVLYVLDTVTSFFLQTAGAGSPV